MLKVVHLIKKLILMLILLMSVSEGWCQTKVSGIVFSSDDMTPIPGVYVTEKGTTNGTTSASDGTFSMIVTDLNSILVFSFVGYVTQEVKLTGRDKVDIRLKVDCIRDWFDSQRIAIYANSGVINNPIGGQFELSFPAYFGKGTLVSGMSYQTNFASNTYVNGQVEFKHFVWNCNFDADLNLYYRSVSFRNGFKSRAYSFETSLNFGRLNLIAGYSNLSLNKIETTDKQISHGGIVGLATWISGPLSLLVTGKVAIYKHVMEYQGQITRKSRKINVFVKYYKLDSFNELSLGVGKEFGYRLKRSRM